MSPPYWIAGLSILGEEPLEPENRTIVAIITGETKKRFPKKDIWLYTGFTFEEIMRDKDMLDCISHVDVLVDGAYVETLRDPSLPFRGSRNQRIIRLQESIRLKTPVLYSMEKGI